MTEARFLTPLRTEKIGERRWLLIDDLVFRSAELRGKLIAPRGFQTDLASIPRIAWTIFPKVGKHDHGAVMHDGAYGNVLVTEHGDRVFLIKRLGDALFLEGMKAEGVNGASARVMYRLVKLFGRPEGHPLARTDPAPPMRALTGDT